MFESRPSQQNQVTLGKNQSMYSSKNQISQGMTPNKISFSQGKQSINSSGSNQFDMKFSEEAYSSQDEDIDNENENELNRIRKNIPERIRQLLLQPKRDLDMTEEVDQAELLQAKNILASLQGKQDNQNEDNEELGDVEHSMLQKALIIEDTEFTQFLEKNVEMQLKQNKNWPTLIISYKSKKRIYWDLVVILFALQNCIFIPIQLAFGEDFFGKNAIDILNYFGYGVDVLFFCDILISFRTSYLNVATGKEINQGKLISKRYILSGNFFLDFLATIPFDDVVASMISNEGAKHLGLLGLVKMTRMLRLRKIVAFMNVQQSLKVSFKMIQLILLLLIIIHWVCCIWYFLVQQQQSYSNGKQWIPPFDISNDYSFYESQYQYQYLVVFYYSVLILIGKANEVTPVNEVQTIYISIILIFGCFVLTFILGNITATLETASINESKFQERLNYIQSTMILIKLPEELQDQVLKYIMQAEQSAEIQHDIHKFLDTLSPSLKLSVQNYLHHQVVGVLDELREAQDAEINFISNNLKAQLVLPDEMIFEQGSHGNKMYFIIQGKLQVILNQSSKVNRGQTFYGEAGSAMRVLKNKKLRKKNSAYSEYFQTIPDEQTQIQPELSSSDSSISSTGQKLAKSKTQQFKNNVTINHLEKGQYFGEIAILSKMRRTASVVANDFCTLSSLTSEVMTTIKHEYPQIYINFLKRLNTYQDEEMLLRKQMIRNIPYLKNASENLITSLLHLMRENVYDNGALVVKHGDLSDRIHIIWKGKLKVQIFYNAKDHLFEKLNRGSNFCVFSAFSTDYTQMFDFKVSSAQATVLSLKSSEIIKLSKQDLELADIIKTLEVSIKKHKKSDFDFFRFFQQVDFHYETDRRQTLRLKFRKQIFKIARGIRTNRIKLTETLIVIQEICQQRKLKEQQMKLILINKDLDGNKGIEKFQRRNTIPSQLRSRRESVFSQTSKDMLTSDDQVSSSQHSFMFNPNFNLRDAQELEKNQERTMKLMSDLEAQSKKYKLQNILNIRDAPGVDMSVFDRIDCFPKDQNMYTVSMIEKYENLRERIIKVKETKENVQYLNKVIYKQNQDILNLKKIFQDQTRSLEQRMALLTQELRKKKKVLVEEASLIEQEKTLGIEPKIVEKVETMQTRAEQEYASFGMKLNQGAQIEVSSFSQAVLQNQIDNYLIGKSNVEIVDIERESKIIVQNDQVEQETKVILSEDQVNKEDGENLIKTLREEDQSEVIQKRGRSKKNQKRKQKKRGATLKEARLIQDEINEYACEASVEESQIFRQNQTTENKKVRHVSRIINEASSIFEVQFLDQDQSPNKKEEFNQESQINDNLGNNLKSLAEQATKYSKVKVSQKFLQRPKSSNSAYTQYKRAKSEVANKQYSSIQEVLIDEEGAFDIDQNYVEADILEPDAALQQRAVALQPVKTQQQILKPEISYKQTSKLKRGSTSKEDNQRPPNFQESSQDSNSQHLQSKNYAENRISQRQNDQVFHNEEQNYLDSRLDLDTFQSYSYQTSNIPSRARLFSAKPRVFDASVRNILRNQDKVNTLPFYDQLNRETINQSDLNSYSSAAIMNDQKLRQKLERKNTGANSRIERDFSDLTFTNNQSSQNTRSQYTVAANKTAGLLKNHHRSQSHSSTNRELRKKVLVKAEDQEKWQFYRRLIQGNPSKSPKLD